MSEKTASNRVGELRRRRGWSQRQLAERVGVSRAGLGAIEAGEVVPSVATALRLAEVLGCTVEALFGSPAPRFAGPTAAPGERVWVVGDRLLRVEPTAVGEIHHDAVVAGEGLDRRAEPEPTLVVAGCDPAVGLLGAALARRGVRLVPLQRGTRAALEALASGVADVAGIHLADPEGNASVIRDTLGAGFQLAHLARWREGVAVTGSGPGSASSLVRARTRWVAREEGSGARACLDRLFREAGREPVFARVARDHRSVAQLVRDGWGAAGVCVELVAAEAGLAFLTMQTEAYDLCFRSELEDDPRIAALLSVLRDRSFRALVGDLPGYDPSSMGEVRAVA
ncbi:MAG TPA: substrate-binding domain-containing protein [Actinomycetota bacterium]|nr:substrate-binding domain-containing protein [Actinomycetota bacterium]